MTTMITSGFDSLSPSDYLTQAQLIVSSMTGNPNFPEPWAPPVPSLVTISTDLDAYQEVLNATLAGDRTRVTARKSARDTLSSDLLLLRLYVEMMGHGDPAKIATSGFPLRQQPVRTVSAEPPPAPSQFKLQQGPVSGTIVVRCGRVPTAGSYEVQLASADPTVESNWNEVGVFKGCRRITIDGLTPGKTYSVRMRAIGSGGAGAWTSPASMMVI